MRSTRGISGSRFYGERGRDREMERLASSPDQIAAVWSHDGSVVIASPHKTPTGYTLDVIRFPADQNLGAAVEMRRRGQLGLPALSGQTIFATATTEFSERTRLLALDGERLAMSEHELAQWLVQAEESTALGTDNYPLFETSLEETACSICRLPNGQVAMTEVPRPHVELARDRMRPLLGPSVTPANQMVETPVRCVARYFLTAMREGQTTLRAEKKTEVTAFLLITRSGYSFGLWSPQTGLFDEYSFLAPAQIGSDTAAANLEKGAKGKVSGRLDNYIRQAFDQLFLQLSPERLEQLSLRNYSQLVWAASGDLADPVESISHEYSEKSGLHFARIPVAIDEAVASGLLFGTFAFDDTRAAGNDHIRTVNLARDLLVLADTELYERRSMEAAAAVRRRNRAIFSILAAPVAAAALFFALAADLVRESVFLGFRESRADAKAEELKPAIDRRRSYQANLEWYREFVTQVSSLRKQQPVGIGMLYSLDSNFPYTLDPSFYVSEMRLSPTGDIEMKGLAQNKDAIAAFLKSLEFAGGQESGSRLFAELTYQVQEGTALPASGPRPTVPAGAQPLMTTNLAPGIISWGMKGKFVPISSTVPPPTPPGAPPPAAPAPAAR